eukprot:CAMPEP_0178908232 /NCGR_PEP_ID=MMETSP0786-20121207/7808_1 /TAXON_ID=186022 /ORGANISM="Thalassionema frauenfeldii, Strain CCMP 1798" /LENGTH=300 /DNA_ID=CAMNT_0020580111 /DNA_START=1962 /DNA_END=2865 /DNA_ORIENTATION=-
MTNDFCIGSDGSVSSNNGSYACRLQHTSDRNIFIQIHALFHTTSSFTAEAYGFLAALYLLRAFYNYFHIIPPPATINSYIDYQPLIQRLSYGKETSIKHVNRRDSSLIREIHTVLDSLAITISRTHIKSHEYDKIDDYNLIPLPNFVNKCCDISAGLAYKCDLCSPPKTQQFPSTSVHVLHDQQIIDLEIQRKLLFQSYNEKMRKQINDKEDWDEDTFNLVHWNYYQQALSQSTADNDTATYALPTDSGQLINYLQLDPKTAIPMTADVSDVIVSLKTGHMFFAAPLIMPQSPGQNSYPI